MPQTWEGKAAHLLRGPQAAPANDDPHLQQPLGQWSLVP